MLIDIILSADILSVISLSVAKLCHGDKIKHRALFDADCDAESGYAECCYVE
jgi:hypothetical protein